MDGAFFDITLGNIITWAGLLITIGVQWQKIKSLGEASATRASENGAKIAAVEVAVKHLDEKGGAATTGRYNLLSQRVASLETRTAIIESTHSQIAVAVNDIKWIKSVLKSVLRHNNAKDIPTDDDSEG